MLQHSDRQELTTEWENCTFTFDEWDYSHDFHRRHKPIVISGLMGQNHASDIYVDNGICIDVMYKHFFKQLPRYVWTKDSLLENHLVSFTIHNIWPEGIITLPLTLNDYFNGRNNTQLIRFVIINAHSPYNVVFGRTVMHKFKAIVSTINGSIKCWIRCLSQ